jgi:ribosomal-protein-alanine N-acetyltransferase
MKPIFRTLHPSDVTKEYADWFKNPIVTCYSDNQYYTYSCESQKKYVNRCLCDSNILLLGIFVMEKHIGNICLVGLTSPHRRIDVSYILGETSYWGKGVMSTILTNVLDFATHRYRPHKFTAGVSALNLGSRKVLTKCGFVLQCQLRDHLYYNGKFSDMYQYELFITEQVDLNNSWACY